MVWTRGEHLELMFRARQLSHDGNGSTLLSTQGPHGTLKVCGPQTLRSGNLAYKEVIHCAIWREKIQST